MIDYTINRVPVVSGERLVGIVSRSDLVRAFIRSDAEIEHELREDVLHRAMLLNPAEFDISVEQGRVVLSGNVNTQEDAEILERSVRRIPGVLDVESNLRWSPPDSRRSR
jgi:osmotically-inducible protein OsmY